MFIRSGLCKKSSDSCLGVSRLRFCFASLSFYLPLCFMWTDLQEFDGGVNHKAPRNVKGLHSSRDAYMLVYTRRKQADSGNSYFCSGFWRAVCHLTTRIIIDYYDKNVCCWKVLGNKSIVDICMFEFKPRVSLRSKHRVKKNADFSRTRHNV